jgi:glycosyltransferase involved in cell wall biosynthesis
MVSALIGLNPRVTVLMPVYNGEAFLPESIESILAQTFNDFEFLIINDGSTDKSASIIDSYSDERIKHLMLNYNHGIVAALNIGLREARGEYIIRMDADDISLPVRIQEQVSFMDFNPDVGVCGTLAEVIGAGQMGTFMDSSLLKAYLLLDCPFVHSSVIIRASVIRQHELRYSGNLKHVEDFQLWVTMSKLTRLAIMPRVHILYRHTESQVSTRHRLLQENNAGLIRQILYEEILLRPLTDTEKRIICPVKPKEDLNLDNVLVFCRQIFSKNSIHSTENLKFVLTKLVTRNLYQVSFSFLDYFKVLTSNFLSIKVRLSILKYLFQKHKCLS